MPVRQTQSSDLLRQAFALGLTAQGFFSLGVRPDVQVFLDRFQSFKQFHLNHW